MGFYLSTLRSAFEFKQLRNLLNILLALMFLVSLSANFLFTNKQAGALAEYPRCTGSTGTIIFGPSETSPRISASGGSAQAVFTFPGQCKGQNIPVTLVSYKSPNNTDGKPYEQQEYFTSVTRNYNVPRSDATITVAIPDCYFQVDLVIGSPIMNFNTSTGTTYGKEHRLLGSIFGGSKSCFEHPAPASSPATAPTTPPAPAPAPAPASNTNSNNTTNINQTNNNTVNNNTTVSNSKGVCVNNSTNTNQGNSASSSNGGTSNSSTNQELNSSNDCSAKVVTKTEPKQPSRPHPAKPPSNKTTYARTASADKQVSEPVTYSSYGGSSSYPSSLPNTGPGEVMAFAPIAFGTTFMGSMLVSYRRRFPDLLASIVSKM